jgi:hypothetical protein
MDRTKHFVSCKSPQLSRIAYDYYHSRFTYNPFSGQMFPAITESEARQIVSKAQSALLNGVDVGYMLHILIGSQKTIAVGEVEEIGETKVWLKGHKKPFNLSEVCTVTLPD